MADSNVMLPNSVNALPVSKPVRLPVLDGEKRLDSEVDVDSTEASNEFSPEVTKAKPEKASNLISTESVENTLDELNMQLEKLQNYLRFEQDKDTDKVVIFIKNRETDEVIRQIPSQEFLKISKNITKFLEMQQLSNEAAPPPGLITHETA